MDAARIIVKIEKAQAAELVLRTWEKFSGVSRKRLRARGRNLHEARWVLACALRELGLSLHEIADVVNRDHSTVHYGLQACSETEIAAGKLLLKEAGL